MARPAPAGKPPKKRRRRSLVDVWFANAARPDPTPGPPVELAPKLHPIRHSSMN